MTAPDPSTRSTADPEPLFSRFTGAGLDLANRFVMAPMTRAKSPNGVPGSDVAQYYARRAHLGLLITEGTYVDHPSAGDSADVPRMYGPGVDGWRDVVDAVHRAGGKIFPQLWHVGATRADGSSPHPEAPTLSPSGTDLFGAPHGTAATAKDIDDVIGAFARSAKQAQAAGFDGLELHGAHGYLLDEFWWDVTNRRDDGYGGDIARRVRLSAEVVSAVRAEVGPDLPISYRFSQWKGPIFDARVVSSPDELERYLAPLQEAGVSMWHVSTRRYWEPAFADSPTTLAGWTKRLTGLPTITIGSVGVRTPFLGTEAEGEHSLDLAPLLRLYEAGEFDLVGLGRAVLSDPEWTNKVRTGNADRIRQHDKAHLATLY